MTERASQTDSAMHVFKPWVRRKLWPLSSSIYGLLLLHIQIKASLESQKESPKEWEISCGGCELGLAEATKPQS